MKKFTLIFAFVALFLTACVPVTRWNYIILLDNSRTISPETTERYIRIIEQTVLPKLRYCDRLTIQFIDQCSVTLSEKIITFDLSTMKFDNLTDGYMNMEDSSKSRVKQYINASVINNFKTIILQKKKEREGCSDYTDIINALRETQKLLIYRKNYTTKTDQLLNLAKGVENYEYKDCIIILSDMIHTSENDKTSFNNLGDYQDPDIIVPEMIKKMKSTKQIPLLSKTKVLVYGSTSSPFNSKNANKQIENIHSFWIEFFRQAKADLAVYGFDSETEISDFLVSTDNKHN